MLIYHPANDINHCLYRMLLILETTTAKELNWNLFKLMDFYTLFPHLLKTIAPLPKSLMSYKESLKGIPSPFEALPNSKRVLFDLEGIQNTSILNLLAKDLVNLELFQEKRVKRTSKGIPPNLNMIIKNDPIKKQEWFTFVTSELPFVSFRGHKGLKARSGLMEFRYDSNV